MYVKAWVETGTEQKSAVPNDAIVQLDGLDYIIIQTADSKDGYTFQLVQVAKGMEQEGYTAIELPQSVNQQSLKVVTKMLIPFFRQLKTLKRKNKTMLSTV